MHQNVARLLSGDDSSSSTTSSQSDLSLATSPHLLDDPMTMAELDSLIGRLLSAAEQPSHLEARAFASITAQELFRLCATAKHAFSEDAVLVRVQPPVTVCGDIHGQLIHLVHILAICGHPPQTQYLFLGDYVDRGSLGIETIALMFALKSRWPDKMHLLRGNHESVPVNAAYGFKDELISTFGCGIGGSLSREFGRTFEWMPLTAIIKDKIFCAHGGLSPFVQSIDQLASLQRPAVVPPGGLVCDLLWSDPGRQVGWAISDRNVSMTYGTDVVKQMCARLNVSMIFRGHQQQKHGVRFGSSGRVLTIFSAPDYCNWRNDGAVVMVDQDLHLSITALRPSSSAMYLQKDAEPNNNTPSPPVPQSDNRPPKPDQPLTKPEDYDLSLL